MRKHEVEPRLRVEESTFVEMSPACWYRGDPIIREPLIMHWVDLVLPAYVRAERASEVSADVTGTNRVGTICFRCAADAR